MNWFCYTKYKLQEKAFEFIALSKKTTDNLTDEEHKALRDLASDKSIVVSKAEKGNAVVIQNLTTYHHKIASILNKDNKFMLLENDHTKSREKKLQYYLRTLKNKPRIQVMSDATYENIMPCGSKEGVLYGSPKIH